MIGPGHGQVGDADPITEVGAQVQLAAMQDGYRSARDACAVVFKNDADSRGRARAPEYDPYDRKRKAAGHGFGWTAGVNAGDRHPV